MEVVAQLKQDGIEKGLCRLWQMKLKSGLSVAELSDLYIRGIDFCVSEDYPTLDFMRSNFRGQCEPYGIYIDDEEYLPIAFDSFGNSIAISMSNGSIVFIDHEQSSAIKKIADNLTEFISKVKSNPISPKHTKSVQERERDLISRGRGQIITDELRALWQKEIEKYSNIHQETVVL